MAYADEYSRTYLWLMTQKEGYAEASLHAFLSFRWRQLLLIWSTKSG